MITSLAQDQLSEDSQRRLEVNPLRILDAKAPGDAATIAAARPYDQYLNAASEDFFGNVRDGPRRISIVIG